MRITKRLRLTNDARNRYNSASQSKYGDEITEEDDEILSKSKAKSHGELLIIYDIVHSPSYQVPVLYLKFQGEHPSLEATDPKPRTFQPSPEELYDLLVSSSHRPQLQGVGVMGALSMTDHPVSGRPVYFVHPCRTAESMNVVLAGRECGVDVKPEVYLMMWLGLVGGAVGLDVPVELAQHFLTAVNRSNESNVQGDGSGLQMA